MDIPLKKDHFELYCCPQGIEAYWKRLPDYMKKKVKRGLTFPELISWATTNERHWIHLVARKEYPEEYKKFYIDYPCLDLWRCGTLEKLILNVEEKGTLFNMNKMTVRDSEFYCERNAVFKAADAYVYDALFSGEFEIKSERSEFTDVGFEGLMRYFSCYDAKLRDCVFNGQILLSTFKGADFGGSTFADIEIKHTDFKGVTFDVCEFKNVKFVDCVFKDCKFRKCRFDGVVLKDCLKGNYEFVECENIFAQS